MSSPATSRTAQNGIDRSIDASQGMSDDQDSPWKTPRTIRSADISQDAHRREPVMPLEQLLAVPGRLEQSRNQVSHDPQQPHREHAEHHHVSMADDPVGEMDQRLERQRRLERALQAGQEVERPCRCRASGSAGW